MNRIQVAGVLDERELQLFFDLDIDDIAFPVGPGVRTPDMPAEQARRLARAFPTRRSSVAIIYLTTCEALTDFCSRYPHFRKIQLHAPIPLNELKRFRSKMPNVYLIKSLVIGERSNEETLEEAKQFAPFVDAFLTDTFDPTTGARGVTGRTHDWKVSRAIRDLLPSPLILAGGLTPENVALAIEAVEPFGVDVHSGVEGHDGRKDAKLLAKFVDEARRAFCLLSNDT